NGALVVTRGGFRGIAQAAHVWRNHGVTLGQRRNDLAPLIPGLRPSVQQHHRLTLPGADVVQANVVDCDGVVLLRRWHCSSPGWNSKSAMCSGNILVRASVHYCSAHNQSWAATAAPVPRQEPVYVHGEWIAQWCEFGNQRDADDRRPA